jgi:DNA-binding MarR family transcriptional regulator
VPATSSATEIRHLILAAQRHGSRIMADHLRAASLTPAQAEVLQVLSGHEPLTLVQLGRLMISETGSPSRLVDTLVTRGLVTREPGCDDKRVVLLRLTPAGQQTLADGRAQTTAIDDLIAERLTPGEMTDLARMLRKLLLDTPGGRAIEMRYPSDATARPSRAPATKPPGGRPGGDPGGQRRVTGRY